MKKGLMIINIVFYFIVLIIVLVTLTIFTTPFNFLAGAFTSIIMLPWLLINYFMAKRYFSTENSRQDAIEQLIEEETQKAILKQQQILEKEEMNLNKDLNLPDAKPEKKIITKSKNLLKQ